MKYYVFLVNSTKKIRRIEKAQGMKQPIKGTNSPSVDYEMLQNLKKLFRNVRHFEDFL